MQEDESQKQKSIILSFVVILAVTVSVFLLMSSRLSNEAGGMLGQAFTGLQMEIRGLMITRILSSVSSAGLGGTADFAAFLLIEKGWGLSMPPLYETTCSANTSESAAKCIVEMVSDCYKRYGSGKRDLFIGRQIEAQDLSGLVYDKTYYDFSIPCAVVTLSDSNLVSITELENFYSSYKITTGNKTGDGEVLTYKELIGKPSLTSFVDFSADKSGLSLSDSPLVIKIKFVDRIGDSTGTGGYHGMENLWNAQWTQYFTGGVVR